MLELITEGVGFSPCECAHTVSLKWSLDEMTSSAIGGLLGIGAGCGSDTSLRNIPGLCTPGNFET